MIPAWAVSAAFGLAALFCLGDIIAAQGFSRKLFRFFQSMVCIMAAVYYLEAASKDAVPSPELRYVWIALCAIIIGEVISRQSWGGKR